YSDPLSSGRSAGADATRQEPPAPLSAPICASSHLPGEAFPQRCSPGLQARRCAGLAVQSRSWGSGSRAHRLSSSYRITCRNCRKLLREVPIYTKETQQTIYTPYIYVYMYIGTLPIYIN